MPIDTLDRARALIQSRLTELETEAEGLQRALAGLGEGPAAPPRRREAKPAATKRRRKTSGRAPRGRRRDELLAALKANPGARPSELARAIGVSANQIHGLIKKARTDKLVVKKGKGYALKN